MVRDPERAFDPVLHTFQSDGYSALVSEHCSAVTGNFYRKGLIKREFLAERSVVKTIDVHSHIVGKLMMAPSRSLDLGCTAWHIWNANLLHFPMLRELGCEGPVMRVCIQDGLHENAFGTHTQAYHSLYYEAKKRDVENDEDLIMLENTDLCFSVRCVGHVGSNGLKWGHRRFSSEEILKRIHVALRSLVSTSFTLKKRARMFIVCFAAGVPSDKHPWSERELFWQALGVDPDTMQLFKRANPVWDPIKKVLEIDCAFMESQTWIDELEKIFIFGYAWMNFSDSRFGKIGPCARKWVTSCALGLDECFKLALEDPTTSKYYANGYLQCDEEVRLWLAVASLSTYAVEAMVIDVLEDDRFFARANQLRESMDAETAYVSTLPDHVLAAILYSCGVSMTVAEFRHQVVLSLHISRGYVYIGSFHCLTKDPWALTQNNIPENTRSLKAREHPPQDLETRKMWTALQCGWAEASHSRSMELLADTGAAVFLSEKSHGFTSQHRNKHLRLSADALVSRSLSAESTSLTAKRKADVAIENYKRKLARMEETGPKRVNAKNMYCSKLTKEAKDENDAMQAKVKKNAQVVKDHHAKWQVLSASGKLECVEAAFEENRRRELDQAVQMEKIRDGLHFALQRKEVQQQEAKGVPNTLSALRFSDDELKELADRFYGKSFQGNVGDEEWARLTRPPDVPDADVMAVIEEQERRLSLLTEKKPSAWLWDLMIQRRDMFEGTAICFLSDMTKAYYFLLGKMGCDRNLVFLQGLRQPRHMPAVERLDNTSVAAGLSIASFDCGRNEYFVGEDIEFPANCTIYLYEDVKFTGTRFDTKQKPVLIEDFIMRYPAPRRPLPSTGGRSRPSISKDWFRLLQEEFPWLTEDDFPDEAPGGPAARDGAARENPARPMRMSERDLDENMAIDIRRRLLERRAAWERDFSDMFFFVRIQGGGWTQRFKGSVVDCATMFARSASKDFCDIYALPKQKGFMYSRYTEEGANMLAWEWARRCSFFFELWRDSGADYAYQFSDEELDSYTSDEEFLDWALTLADDTWCFEAVRDLLHALPTNP